MKVTWTVIFSLSCFAAIYGHPGRRDGLEEVEIIPLESQFGREPVIDTGALDGPFFNPFDGLFENVAGMMTRLRQHLDRFWGRTNTTVGNLPFPNFSDIDLGKGNTTSVTKVIDGHKVVINETEYKKEDTLGGTFFKVRIIDVLPDSSELTTEKNAEEIPTKDVESVENSNENEIEKSKEVFSNVETFDEADSFRPFQRRDNLDSFEDNAIEPMYSPHDLSRDIYVNQLLADAGAPINPDAEVFSAVESNYPYVSARRQPFETITYHR